jgi:hypothetical protein
LINSAINDRTRARLFGTPYIEASPACHKTGPNAEPAPPVADEFGKFTPFAFISFRAGDEFDLLVN